MNRGASKETPATTPAGAGDQEPAKGRRRREARSTTEVLPRVALRLEELGQMLGVGRRTLERERSAGRFPVPDLLIGNVPLWRPETVRAWVERGGHPS